MEKGIKTMVISAGGEGKRLASYFNSINFKDSKMLFPINDKPLLWHVIENALAVGMENLYILLNHRNDKIKRYLLNQYKKNKKIHIIEILNNDVSICKLLMSTKKYIKSPFVYADGNIYYSKSILKKIAHSSIVRNGKMCVDMVVSKKDYAPTHLKIIVDDLSQIVSVDNRCSNNIIKKDLDGSVLLKNENFFYSLGLMCFSDNIFNIINKTKEEDLDLVIENLFQISTVKLKQNTIQYTEYDGEWVGIHNSDDLVFIEEKFEYIKNDF